MELGESWHAHFANELATECVDDAGHRGRGTLADEVKVEHALHGTGLQSAIRTLLDVPRQVERAAVGLTRRSIVSWGGRACVQRAGSWGGWARQNDGCCRWRRGHRST
jgi:hypothetical protein